MSNRVSSYTCNFFGSVIRNMKLYKTALIAKKNYLCNVNIREIRAHEMPQAIILKNRGPSHE